MESNLKAAVGERREVRRRRGNKAKDNKFKVERSKGNRRLGDVENERKGETFKSEVKK